MSLSSKAEQCAKKAENYPFFGSVNLTSMRDNVGEILKLIGREGIFREYTLHDANHIDAMLALVDRLIPADTAEKMKTADWLMIVLSCYFHDLGMLVTKKEYDSRNNCSEFLAFKTELLAGDKGKDYAEALEKLTQEEREEFLYQEFVRKHHAKRISLWIQGQNAPQYGDAEDAVSTVNELLAGLEQVVRDDLAKICLSHHEDDLFDFDKYHVKRVYGDNPEGWANLHYAALMLRTADVLQIQKKRVPPVLYKLIDPSNPKSQEEWAKQAGVRAVIPKTMPDGSESDTIEVHASFDEERAYFGLLAYLEQFAGKELERCHDWAMKAQQNKGVAFQYPWKQIDTSQVDPRGFEGHRYSFKLDQEKILKLLTGHTLYNDSRVAIREVLQNALDAVRYRKHLFPDEPMGKIDIIWDSRDRKLTVRDTGTGMTLDTIEKFLLNVGSSFYQSEAVLHAGFSAISRFGIGVLSTFMIADNVQILTVHPDDEFARRLTLPSVVKSYLIKKIDKGDPDLRAIGQHGTEVILQVRRSADLNDVEAIVRYWLVIPQCEVTCKTDGSAPVSIGYPNARAVLDYYYHQEKAITPWKSQVEVRTESGQGIELAYVVSKSDFADVWDFAKMYGYRKSDNLPEPPGMCVGGIRVRSVPAGYDRREGSPWAFANLIGKDVPKTNVARSDVEQTPELDHALLQIYSLLGRHIKNEFNRLQIKKTGIVEAAMEADYLRTWGLERSFLSSNQKFNEAMSDIAVIALEEENACRVVTQKDLESLEKVWSVDSRLVQNLEGICGILGIDQPASKIIGSLGKAVQPVIPEPRILGGIKRPLAARDVGRIRIYPEERSHRIDICWEKERPGRWVTMPRDLFRNIAISRASLTGGRHRLTFESIFIKSDANVSSECPGYDLVFWRRLCFILATSPIPRLLDVLGMNEQFAHWLAFLLQNGEIPVEERPLLKQQLAEANCQEGEELLSNLVLPFSQRFGDFSGRGPRGDHIFFDDWENI
jgi:molecular chaperone HtpG